MNALPLSLGSNIDTKFSFLIRLHPRRTLFFSQTTFISRFAPAFLLSPLGNVYFIDNREYIFSIAKHIINSYHLCVFPVLHLFSRSHHAREHLVCGDIAHLRPPFTFLELRHRPYHQEVDRVQVPHGVSSGKNTTNSKIHCVLTSPDIYNGSSLPQKVEFS